MSQSNAQPHLDDVEEIRRACCAIKDFPLHSVLSRYCLDSGVERGVAEANLRELVRYLVLCATAPQHRRYPMFGDTSGPDGVWHTFLLFTRSYAEFCEGVGGRFIHHQPAAPDDDASQSDDRPTDDDYAEFLERYAAAFGEPAPLEVWPRMLQWNDLLGPYRVPATVEPDRQPSP